MDGRTLALGAVGAFALAGAVGRRGARNHAFSTSLHPFAPWDGPGPTPDEVFAWVDPRDFCRLASTNCDKLDKRLIRKYAADMRRADASFPVPSLEIDCAGRGPCAVSFHDGRHRAMAALAAGHARIPVVLQARVPGPGWDRFKRDALAERVEVWSQPYDDEEIERSRGRLLEADLVDVEVHASPRDGSQGQSSVFGGRGLRARLAAILADFEEDDLVEDVHGRLDDLVARFEELGVTLLASGSQRIVFDLGDGTVGKVDYDVDATANKLEAKNWREWRAVRPLLCPVLQTLACDRLLIMPKAEDVFDLDFAKSLNKRRVKKVEAAIQTLRDMGITLFDVDFDPNWGWYDGGPVLLDYAQEPE